VGLLNQVVMMSTQLYNDATTPAHHKYAAHQVALLYVSAWAPWALQRSVARAVRAQAMHAGAVVWLPAVTGRHQSRGGAVVCDILTLPLPAAARAARCPALPVAPPAIAQHAAGRHQAHPAPH
jgi:hypothetical protein